MYKVMFLLKRKSGMTHEQFREHFERSHAPMAQKYCGHLFTAYHRNYVGTVFSGGDSRAENSGYGPKPWQWDVISEWILPDEAAFHEIIRIMETPDIKKEFQDDEDRFIDRDATVVIPCEMVDTGTGAP